MAAPQQGATRPQEVDFAARSSCENNALNRRSRLPLDTSVAPVHQNGCFEIDRVIKSGCVQKRTQKTKVRSASQYNFCPFFFFCSTLRLDLTSVLTRFCTIHRTGRAFTLFYDQMPFLYTRMTRKPSSDIKFTCQNSLPSPSSRTQSTSEKIYLDFFPPRETSILRPPRHRMQKNGLT